MNIITTEVAFMKYSSICDFKMETLKETPVLKFNPNTLQEVRNLRNLNNSERIMEAIKLLEDWIQKQEHFVNKNFDRDYLERFIIHSKGSTERVKSKLDSLCTFRTLIPEYFRCCDVNEIINVPQFKDIAAEGYMRKLTPDNYRVYLLKIKKLTDVTQETTLAYLRYWIMVTEYLFKHDYVAGYIYIHDLRNINILEYISKLDMTEMKRFSTGMRNGFGSSGVGVHYITDSKLVETLINVSKGIMSTKVAQRVYIHSNLESLHEMVPKEILCADYGGQEMPLEELRDYWIETLASHENKNFIKSVNELRTDESKRIGENKSDEYLTGSFRTLNVD